VLHLSLAGNGVASHGKATSAARAALTMPTGVCSIFMCPNNGMAANVTCTDVGACDWTWGLHEHRKGVLH